MGRAGVAVGMRLHRGSTQDDGQGGSGGGGEAAAGGSTQDDGQGWSGGGGEETSSSQGLVRKRAVY